MSAHSLKLSIAVIALSLSMGANAAGYLKIGDIKGELQNSEAPQSAQGKTATSQGEPINGGLNRDTIRRTANSDKPMSLDKTKPKQTTSTPLPTGETRLHGIEPDEID
ncbi:MAG TPA: hypothetical protein VIC08_00890 [Cellvibrionaceae bacterium]